MNIDTKRHPCFNKEARHKYGRVHLPVAPKCNIKCGFCNRKFDCASESRPGVSSEVLKPEQALWWLDKLIEKKPNISVVGIAGPGDPFANPEETMDTLRMVRRKYPEMLLCVSSNGLGILPYIEELAYLEVSHVTITVCAPDSVVGANIYEYIKDDKVIYRGEEAANILLTRQLEAISKLSSAGITVKVNMIVIPGVNDDCVREIAHMARGVGASLLNLMPLCPVEGTRFENANTPTEESIKAAREIAEKFLPQMTHCRRCRADAAGILGEDMDQDTAKSLEQAKTVIVSDRPYVAVASREGALVNMHLGESECLWIFKKEGDSYLPIEKRGTPPKGAGDLRWMELARILPDCRALLASGMGSAPRDILEKLDVVCVEIEGLIEEVLEAIYAGKEVRSVKRSLGCGEACAGCGTGCA